MISKPSTDVASLLLSALWHHTRLFLSCRSVSHTHTRTRCTANTAPYYPKTVGGGKSRLISIITQLLAQTNRPFRHSLTRPLLLVVKIKYAPSHQRIWLLVLTQGQSISQLNLIYFMRRNIRLPSTGWSLLTKEKKKKLKANKDCQSSLNQSRQQLQNGVRVRAVDVHTPADKGGQVQTPVWAAMKPAEKSFCRKQVWMNIHERGEKQVAFPNTIV